MKKNVKVLLLGLFLMGLFLNATVVADMTTDNSDLTFRELNIMPPLLPQIPPEEGYQEEEPGFFEGGSIGEATITCSGSGYGRCYQNQFVFCTSDPFGGYECVFFWDHKTSIVPYWLLKYAI